MFHIPGLDFDQSFLCFIEKRQIEASFQNIYGNKAVIFCIGKTVTCLIAILLTFKTKLFWWFSSGMLHLACCGVLQGSVKQYELSKACVEVMAAQQTVDNLYSVTLDVRVYYEGTDKRIFFS